MGYPHEEKVRCKYCRKVVGIKYGEIDSVAGFGMFHIDKIVYNEDATPEDPSRGAIRYLCKACAEFDWVKIRCLSCRAIIGYVGRHPLMDKHENNYVYSYNRKACKDVEKRICKGCNKRK